MAIRRTKKQKEEAKHAFTISWEPRIKDEEIEPNRASNEAIVKGQKKKGGKIPRRKNSEFANTENTGRNSNLGTIKRDIVRSVLMASLILSLEVMLYLIL